MADDEGFTLAEMIAALFVISLVTLGLAGLTRQYADVVHLANSSAAEQRALTVTEAALAQLIFASSVNRTCSDSQITGSCIALDASLAPCSVQVAQNSDRFKVLIQHSHVTSITLEKPARLQCTPHGMTIWLWDNRAWRIWTTSLDLGFYER